MNNKGVSLIIVIFALMLFAVLGGTLAALLSTDFQANLRTLDSEKALYLADAGAQWALDQLHTDFACTSITGATFPHQIGQGEYSCTCDSSTGPLIVDSTGYVPSQANPRAIRKVRITKTDATFTNAITGSIEFNWHSSNGYSNVDINGTIQSRNFEGPDANITYNDNPADLNIKPDGLRVPDPNTVIALIDMGYWEWYALNVKGQVFNGDQTFGKKSGYQNDGVYFVKGNVIIDARNWNIKFEHTCIIATGNIIILGNNDVDIKTHVNNPSPHDRTIPNLATSTGYIESLATPSGGTSGRKFDGLIYSQGKYIDINYIQCDGGLMAPTVKLRGSVDIDYDHKYLDEIGFNLSTEAMTTWQEQ